MKETELVERLKDPPDDVGVTTWTVPCADCEEQVLPFQYGATTVTVAVVGLASRFAGTVASISVGVALRTERGVEFQVTVPAGQKNEVVLSNAEPRIRSVVAGLPVLIELGVI